MLEEEKRHLCSEASESTSNYGTISVKDSQHKRRRKKVGFSDQKLAKSFSLWDLFSFSERLDHFLFIVGSIGAIIHGAGWPFLAIVFGSMTNTFLLQSTNEETDLYANSTSSQSSKSILFEDFNDSMTSFAFYYTYIGIGVFIASVVQISSWIMAGERQIYALKQEFFYQLLRQNISWFDKHQSGELAMHFNDDLEMIREGIGEKCSMIFQYASTFFVGFIVGFIKGWQLTLVIMSLTPLLALSSSFIGKLVASSSVREQEKYSIAGGIAEEVLSNIKPITSFNGQDREVKRYTLALNRSMDVALQKFLYISFGVGFTFLILYSSYALAFWYGSRLVLSNKMTPGDVFTVFFAVMIGSLSLGNAMPYATALSAAKAAGQTIFRIVKSVPKIDPYSKDGIQPKDFSADIQFHNVNFSYPSRKSVAVLKKFCFKVKEGQTVALCGSSGCGKSTIVKLILRLYDPNRGSVTLGDFDLKLLNVHWLRSKIGIVSQEPVLFNETIAKNIEYGCRNTTDSEIIAAAKLANCHEFIMKFPKGYNTVVGEKEMQLSAGQKQRIAIARAVLKDPKILILDEATSALDAESESLIQQALDLARRGKTTIIVAHRLSTLKTADVICVMENGNVKEKGTHDDLMDKCGLYYQLVTNQMFIEDTVLDLKSFNNESGSSNSSSKRSTNHFNNAVHARHHLISTTTTTNEDTEENVTLPTSLSILKESKKEWKLIMIGSIASVVTGIVMPTYAVFYSEIFNTFTLQGNDLKKSAFFWSMMFLALAAVTCLGHIFRTVGYTFAGEKLTRRLRLQTFANILRQNVAWFEEDQHTTGKITSKLATDIPMIKSAASLRIGTIISSSVTLVASITIAFVFGWKLALALTVLVPVLLVAGAIQMEILKRNQKKDAELMLKANETACEAIQNIQTLQSLALEDVFFEKYVGHLIVPFIERKKNAIIYAVAFAFSQSVMFFTYAAAFRLGAFLVAYSQMKTVDVYRVFFAMAFSAVSVGEWSSYLPDYTKAKLSAARIFHLKSIVPSIDISCNGGVTPEIEGQIEFVNVRFSYPNRISAPVLQNVSFTIKPGETLAIVGASGCGKSTLFSLIERFYDPISGQVLVDGYDIKAMNLKHLRSVMAIVSQEPVLFNCTIRENIMYGIEDQISAQDIESAAQAANIHDFIMRLPNGYETMVGEKGTQLSVGEKQCIAIARALVRNPKIVLLDEATSSLDSEREKAVQGTFDVACHGRTCIIIAHRLSTIIAADCIAVMDQGKIVETGSHDELIALKGMYYNLVKRQCN